MDSDFLCIPFARLFTLVLSSQKEVLCRSETKKEVVRDDLQEAGKEEGTNQNYVRVTL